jgi:adenylate kinase
MTKPTNTKPWRIFVSGDTIIDNERRKLAVRKFNDWRVKILRARKKGLKKEFDRLRKVQDRQYDQLIKAAS